LHACDDLLKQIIDAVSKLINIRDNQKSNKLNWT